MQRAIIEGLAPSRRALILPLNYDTFYPGLPLYEDLVSALRKLPKVDVFGFTFPFGLTALLVFTSTNPGDYFLAFVSKSQEKECANQEKDRCADDQL